MRQIKRRMAGSFVWASSLLLAGVCLGEDDSFFTISISLEGRDVFFYGEQVRLWLTVRNPTSSNLRFMQGGGFISDAQVMLLETPSGARRGTETESAPFKVDAWTERKVRELAPGQQIRAVYSFSSEWEHLPSGHYRACARVRQTRREFGLASGDAVSEAVKFSIVPWKAERITIQEFQDAPFGKKVAGLIQTANGDTLAAWRRLPETDVWERVIPVGKDLPLNKLLWAADRCACVIAVPDSIGEKTEVIVAHKHNSKVERFFLKGRPTYPGLNVPGSPWGPPVPTKAQRTERAAPDELSAAGGGWFWLVVALACGGLGAVVGAGLVWLLMRRKRRAA